MIKIPFNVAVLLAVGTTLVLVSGFVLYMMIGEINRKLPESQRISYLFMYPGKMGRIKQQYRRLYPEGRLDCVRFICNIGAFLLALVLLWQIGFFG